MNELALFAGAGGGLLGSRLLGFNTVGACEIDPYARRVLLARQRDGFLDRFPIWDDINTFDGRPWRGSVQLVSGGFPCQDVSASGTGRGLSGDRSSLVFEMLRVVEEVRPRFVFAENSPLLRTRGLGVILEELNRLGYRSAWCVLGAWHVGAPHRRNRMWLLSTNANREPLRDTEQWEAGRRLDLQDSGSAFPSDDGKEGDMAYSELPRLEGHGSESRQSQEPEFGDHGQPLADSDGWRLKEQRSTQYQPAKQSAPGDVFNRRGQRWPDDPADGEAQSVVGRVLPNGMAAGLDRNKRLKAIGNGQVPRVAALAWHILTEMLNNEG